MWRKWVRYAVGFFVLVNLLGVLLSLATKDLPGAGHAAVRLAVWTGLYFYMLHREKKAAAGASPKS
ncbi:MAG: hypothetical protein WC943_02075 [Elusimicrobiota bacterium]|jgi:hypothetical protein